MRVTFIIPTADMSGGNRVVATYAKYLQDRGHTVCVVSLPNDQPTLLQQLKSVVKGKGLIHQPRRLPSHLDRVPVEHRMLEYPRPITDADVPNADVVIATWWETAEWVARLSPAKGAKAYFVQGYELFGAKSKQRLDATYRLPLYKITISNWLVNLLKLRSGAKAIALVPNSVDTTVFQAPPRGKQRVPTVGFVYSESPCKGTDLALRAYELAKQRVPNLRLIVFGRELVADLPLPPGAKFVAEPAQEQLKQLYGQCDAWLFSSREEGFGLPILEAMACRTPVIAFPAGAAPELLAQGGGILVPPKDPEAMAKAIEQVCQMPETEWKRLSSAAYATATNYTCEQATDQFEAALKQAIESASAVALV